MTKLSSVIGMPVLNVSLSCITGTATDVYFDANLKKAVYFCINNADGKTMLLPYSEAQNIADAVVISNDVNLIDPFDIDITSLKSNILGTQTYLPTGVCKGKVEDVILNASGKIAKFKTDGEEFAPSSILSAAEVIILKGTQKIKSKKTQIPRPQTDNPVFILETNTFNQTQKTPETTSQDAPTVQAVTQKIYTTVAKPSVTLNTDPREPVLSNGAFEVLLDGSQAYSYNDDSHTPTRVICDYEFLLGRTLGADLCTYTGELIAKQGCAVTDFVVEQARRAGKLVELTLNSVKPETNRA